MLGLWLSDLFYQPVESLKKRIKIHRNSAFRRLLVGGILLLLVGLLILQPIFQQHREYYLWLAGFTATLGLSFIFAIVSAQIKGYRRYKDAVLGFATGMMLLLSGVLAVTGMFHP
jgi:hypothetical protein